ncbi:hypothetical protein FA10DRAFT_195980 [Acaromyces ingoldii]|uniref:Hydrophobin n=1 Tax=Acaromyces ingoldii TaxID=215250 RepID=A0A316YGB7_9BASI|nr:hypothetical protein FA10DRAFT_195980 [Acaromyces ingoldii]PWN87143.1 hypothetical protein FA10DRAFT_195980 [Acaromyces ingoldii]
MQFSTVVAFFAAAAVVAAAPNAPSSSSTGSCSTGKVQCCSTTVRFHDGAEAKKTAALLGLNDLAGMIGIQCQDVPINIIGAAVNVDNHCKSSPVCCTGSEYNGLVQTGCTNVPVN